jgi:predicted nucleotidyltransferase component of viral defense system
MAFSELYRRQVALLIRVLPLVAEEDCFALKGGTAINLFVRDMPRLSVDIDLTDLPVETRPASLKAINAAMQRIEARVNGAIPGAQTRQTILRPENIITKLNISVEGTQIKIEVTPVMRGCAYDPEMKNVSPAVEAMFGFAETQLVSFADLYAGKIVAALDRQHPRDLFDIRDLLANEGLTDDLRSAFIVYLLSHDRPMAEVLAPNLRDITHEYERGFEGMTQTAVALEELLAARDALIAGIVGGMPVQHGEFLIGFERGEPDWALLGLPHVAKLPAVLWRQQNLDKLSKEARAALVVKLEAALATV